VLRTNVRKIKQQRRKSLRKRLEEANDGRKGKKGRKSKKACSVGLIKCGDGREKKVKERNGWW
jgi:hypothetical protein